jgi:predicted nucleic acid-binding protein
VFYLDTNVAMALLFSAHPAHEEARSAVEAARRLECSVVVSPFTVEELERQLSEANVAYGRIGRRTEALAIADDDILRTYAARRRQSAGLSWTAFRAEYSPPKDALGEFGVEFEETDAAKAHHDERRQKVRDAVAAQKENTHSHVHPKLISYDTDNLLVVQVRRESLHADEMGSRVWFVTLDRSLKGIERKLVRDRVFQIPSSKRMAAWSAELSPHLAPEDPDLGEYVLHLVQSKVGMLAEDPAFAQVNFLATLEESPFDIGKLLDGEPEMARRVLVALQEEREIRELLGKEPEEVESKEEWAKQVAEAVEKALARLESTAEEREELGRMRTERDQAMRDAVALRRERDRSRRRAAELEEERASAEREAAEKHLWQRLWEALRPRKG